MGLVSAAILRTGHIQVNGAPAFHYRTGSKVSLRLPRRQRKVCVQKRPCSSNVGIGTTTPASRDENSTSTLMVRVAGQNVAHCCPVKLEPNGMLSFITSSRRRPGPRRCTTNVRAVAAEITCCSAVSQTRPIVCRSQNWVPAFAGMTVLLMGRAGRTFVFPDSRKPCCAETPG